MAAGNLKEFIKPHLLLVEGTDEMNFFIRMLEFLEIETVQIHAIDGVSSLNKKLGVIKKTPGFNNINRLALLVDSDLNPAGRLQSIRDALAAADLSVPDEPGVIADGAPQVLYSTVPAPEVPGCLENVLQMFFSKDPNTVHVNSYLENFGIQQIPGTSRWPKSWVHSYLSTFEQPGKKIGEATKAGYIQVADPAFEPIQSFVRRLAQGA